jgi:hypothetical protein
VKKSEARKTSRKIVTVIKALTKTGHNEKIPTSLVSLSPDKLLAEKHIDVLVGLFHIMWEDMPRPRTYSIRLADLVSFEGDYVGAALNEGKSEAIDLWRFSGGA